MPCCRERVSAFRPEERERWERYWSVLTGGMREETGAVNSCVARLKEAPWLKDDPLTFCSELQKFLFG